MSQFKLDPMIIVLFLLIIGMVWMMTKQRKSQREAQNFVDSLEPGQEVMTLAGYVGTIVSIDDHYIVLESVPGGAQTKWVKAAIRKPGAGVPGVPQQAATETAADVEIPDNVAKLIGEDTSIVDKHTDTTEHNKRENDK
ncbi:preprotein translocase subunit YajC [Rarobacter incanus]|uniref:Preprotein translocase YajC subunit n=1 Tax=Rarobacter incanus TaxID=153494 RepID=A0A542SMP6_9MICO|nr:preprotein translocase subunit YajC [Rarobacter incanus]TQK75903.1 preprotein translocase YajC subunit [Rarobacter incanus]